MLKALLFLAAAAPALACDCRSVPALQIGVAETLQEELRRGAWHDDPTDAVAIKAEVISVGETDVREVYGSESKVVRRRVMSLLILEKTYDAFNAAPLPFSTLQIVPSSTCDRDPAGFEPGKRYRFVLRPNVYVKGMFKIPLCGVYSEAVK